MFSFTPDNENLLKVDSVACDLCGNEANTMLLSGNVRACKNNEECTGRIVPRKRFEAALDALPDLHLRKIFIKPYGVEAQFKYIPHETYEKWFVSKVYSSELELYAELAPVLEDTTMANIFKMTGDMFKHLVAEMLPDNKDTVLTIKDAHIEELENQQGKEKKVVITFKKFGKGLVLGNKTGVKTLVKLFGDDTDDWIGGKIALYTTHVKAFGKEHYVIRIRDHHPKTTRSRRKPKATTSAEIKDMQTAVTDPIEQEPLFTHEQADIMADEGAYQD